MKVSTKTQVKVSKRFSFTDLELDFLHTALQRFVQTEMDAQYCAYDTVLPLNIQFCMDLEHEIERYLSGEDLHEKADALMAEYERTCQKLVDKGEQWRDQ